MPSFLQQHGAQVRISELPFTVAVGALWMMLVDLPRLVSLGPISLSGGFTLFAATLTLFMLPAYGVRTELRSEGSVGTASARIPWAMWSFVLFLPLSLLITTLSGGIRADSIQNACVYLLFVGAISLAAASKSSAVVLRGWELMRSLATCSAYLMLAASVLNMIAVSALNLDFGLRPMALVALIVLALVTPGSPRDIWMKFAPFATVAAMALSLSRTSTLIGGALLIFVVLRGRRGRRLFKGLFMLLAAASALYLLVVHYAPFRDRFLVGDNAWQVGNLSISTQGRAALWKLLISLSSDHWLLGQGIGSSGRLITEYLPMEADAIGHPHNEYLRLYVEFGIVGLALFVIGYFTLVWRIFRSARRTDHPLHWAAFLALLAIGLSAVTDNPFVYPFVMLPMGSLAGLSLALTRFELSDHRPALLSTKRPTKALA